MSHSACWFIGWNTSEHWATDQAWSGSVCGCFWGGRWFELCKWLEMIFFLWVDLLFCYCCFLLLVAWNSRCLCKVICGPTKTGSAFISWLISAMGSVGISVCVCVHASVCVYVCAGGGGMYHSPKLKKGNVIFSFHFKTFDSWSVGKGERGGASVLHYRWESTLILGCSGEW